MSVGVDVSFAGRDLAAVLGAQGRVVVSDVTGRSLLALEVSTVASVAYDGARFVDAKLPSREIGVEFSMLGDGSEVTARAHERVIQGALLSRTPARLEFSDQPARWYEGILSGAGVQQGGKSWLTGLVSFECPRPFLYAAPVTEAVTDGEHDAQTNWYVEPVWTVQLGASAPSGFVLTVNGRTFEYSGALPSGSLVRIDTQARETRVGGALRVLEVAGTYPVLEADNAVVLSVPGSVSVEYQPRWV